MICTNCGENNLPESALFCYKCGLKVIISAPSVTGEFLPSGYILQKRYKIEVLLGQGGWGAVYKASYVSSDLGRIFGTYCAIKEMKPSSSLPLSSEKLQEIFEGEARVLVHLKHEHIPRITDYFHNDGRYYLVMEYIEGKDLESLLEDNGKRPFPEEKVLQWAVEVCQVLDYLHTRKPRPFIFRDLKPANIVLDRGGKITVIDFGITRIFNPSDPNNLKLGTPGYSSPEQYRGTEDPRADIYSLGITLHYLLSGIDPQKEKPFTLQDIPLRTLNPLISEDLEKIISRAARNDVKERFQSSAEMLEALTSLFWKSLSPGEKEDFQWLESSRPGVTAIPPAVTRRISEEQLRALTERGEEKIERASVHKKIIFAPLPEDTFKSFKEGKMADFEWFSLRMKAEKLSLTAGFNELISLNSLSVTPYTHQKKAALEALRVMRGRVLLADEVGLGKTIEAGLIIKELKLRGLIKKILVLVPASLTTQWQEELKVHFSEDFNLQKEEEDWEKYNQLIASLDTARRENHGDKIKEIKYDLLVIDEAHKLKNRKTKAWKLVNSISKRYILMLTATPVQNNLEELFNLITLLKPGQLKNIQEFRKRFVDPSDKRVPVNAEELKVLLKEVMIRNRRSTVDVYLPPRRAAIYHLKEYPVEMKFRIELTGFLRDYYRRYGREKGVVLQLIQLQKSLGSSTLATLSSLEKWKNSLEKENPDYGRLENLSFLGEKVKNNRKASALFEIIERTSDKILVFTEFLQTQAYLQEFLREKGYEAALFNGLMDIKEKDRQLELFRKERQILISTQSGSEGKNLQFSHIMVNYDLPWNPMKLEQRIGRLHRLTQEREVLVFNLSLQDTFEGYILYLLSEKIKMFELVIGELDLILGDIEENETFEKSLQKIWLESMSDEQLKKNIDLLGDRLLDGRKKFQEAMVADSTLTNLFQE